MVRRGRDYDDERFGMLGGCNNELAGPGDQGSGLSLGSQVESSLEDAARTEIYRGLHDKISIS